MDSLTAQRIIGNQPPTAVKNMAVALSMMTYRNTQDDWTRLEAATVWLKDRKLRVPPIAKLTLQQRTKS